MERLVNGMFVGMSSEEVIAQLEAMGLMEELFEGYSEEDFRAYGEVFLGDCYADFYGIWFDKNGVCMDCRGNYCEE